MQPPEEEENSEELEAAYQQLEAEQQLTEDDMECTGRVVTELVEVGNTPLPDRFMFAMRAIRGEFNPPEGADDNDRAEDAITSALLQFPATIPLRVVTKPITETAYAELAEQLVAMLTALDGAEAAGVTTKERPGQRRSIEFSVRVPDAGALTMLREALKEDDRVQMVF